MKLSELLQDCATAESDVEVRGLTLDSRSVKPGDTFIAVAGHRWHGLAHAQQAIDKGAAAIVYEPADGTKDLLASLRNKPLSVAVGGLGQKLGSIAARFYGDPSAKLAVIGITGTNGKTSCSQFLAQAMGNCGVIGTLGWGLPGRLQQTLNTTPDALSLHAMVAEFAAQGRQAVAMEVSSHALEQGRVNGLRFYAAVFTNFSRDHLDYHGSMEAYVAAKLGLVQKPGLRFVVVNLDDAYCREVLDQLPQGVQVWGYSRSGKCGGFGMESLAATTIEHCAGGLVFEVLWRKRTIRIDAPVFGDFNVENILAVLAVLLALDIPLDEVAGRIRAIRPVSGRMERFAMPDLPGVFVDYAHTPDALEKVLAGLKQHCRGKLWAVFGCGGNRDRGKRPLMGAAAERWADYVILTDDNPRDEDPNGIVQEILAGCRSEKTKIIRDRKLAIEYAVQRADVGDCILIAGKGHEYYQEIRGERMPFSDSLAVAEALQKRSDNHVHAA
jgi:UDP-N-acetylmuramoyl-L-alanyl-D-glutamate--2,6-diaminopimelate ligase